MTSGAENHHPIIINYGGFCLHSTERGTAPSSFYFIGLVLLTNHTDGNITNYYSNNFVWIGTEQPVGLDNYFSEYQINQVWFCVICAIMGSDGLTYMPIPCETSEVGLASFPFLCEVV